MFAHKVYVDSKIAKYILQILSLSLGTEMDLSVYANSSVDLDPGCISFTSNMFGNPVYFFMFYLLIVLESPLRISIRQLETLLFF